MGTAQTPRIVRLHAGALADIAYQCRQAGQVAPLVTGIRVALTPQEVIRIRWLVARLSAKM